jgi:hypothetical protein
VNLTLQRSICGLAAFVLSTLLIVGLLLKANGVRRRALTSLHVTNADLAAAKDVARERASILEMVSTHAPLSQTLQKVVSLASLIHPEVGAAIWTGNTGELRLQATANFSPKLAEALKLHAYPVSSPLFGAVDLCSHYCGRLAAALGFEAGPTKELREASGDRIGMLLMFAPAERAFASQAIVDRMAQLAVVAIENSLLYERLAFQAQHDTLTGLPNRLLFQDRVQQAGRSAQPAGFISNIVNIVSLGMDCEEKYRLLSVYQAKLSAHSAAVDDLVVTGGKVSKQDYVRLWALTENARSESEAASRAFLQHTREHGC